jgi:hypothetical protein
MSIRPFILLGAVAAALAACAPTPGPYGPVQPAAFRADDFAWSQAAGQSSIEGRVAFTQDGKSYACVGSAGLTPDTPYTRARFRTLYGSTERAVVPAAVVRARDAGEAGGDYRAYVRSETCDGGRFSFADLPDGDWFLIVPVRAEGDEGPLVLMRHVTTRGGRVVSVTL